MDELIQILRRIASGPEFDDDVAALSAPPVSLGIGSLPATVRTITSIAQRSPDLIRWLASGKVLKQGSATWNRLTQGLTAAQKKMVAENPQAFRNYFRRVRQPNEAVRVGEGVGPGTSLVRRPTVEVARTTGTAVGPRAQTSVSPTTGTAVVRRTPMAAAQRSPGGIATIPVSMGAGAASGVSGRSLLPWLLGGGTGALALSQLLGGEEAPAAPEVRPDVRGRGAHMDMLESFQGQRPPAPTAPVVERMRELMPTTLVERTRRADMGVPVQDIIMAELRRQPEMRRQFVKSDIPGVMGTWQDLPYELQPATTLSEREIRRMIEASR
jgi:hypothetical protein